MTLAKKRPARRPSHPGAILKRVWLAERGYSPSQFAGQLAAAHHNDVSAATMLPQLVELIDGKRSMNAELAILISKVLGTSPRMWLNLQIVRDIWDAEEEAKSSFR